jgi:hypothetical protein
MEKNEDKKIKSQQTRFIFRKNKVKKIVENDFVIRNKAKSNKNKGA